MSLDTGARLSHYRVLECLGAGGFGVVYRARDERLERDVALKVVPEAAVADADTRERFHREALAATRVSHPNVATIHSLDRDGDTDFIVMEFVAGESLDRRLARGPMDEREALGVAAQLADALDALHELGVVHCDLKPGNVMLTPRGLVKLLDFGLSRTIRSAAEPVDSRADTSPTTIVGTFPYLAPEQVRGEGATARSDLFALGVMLFEMIAGRRPHLGDDAASLLYAIAHTPPPPLRSLIASVAPDVDALVAALLEKAPERRPFPAAAVAGRLRDLLVPGAQAVGVASIAAAPRERGAAPTPLRARDGATSGASRACALAVLPLSNLSADPEQEFFADGMTEAVITHLASLGGLRVISRTSVMRYKGTTRPVPEIARELDVGCIVEGSVLRSGDRVRITVQLVDAASDSTMWARHYERPMDDVLALQTDVARAIAGEIRVHVSPTEAERLGGEAGVEPAAYEAYLRGRYLWNRRTVPDLQRALEFFRRAIEIAPRYARAHAGLADCYNILGDLDVLSQTEALAGSVAAATRALELDADLPEAHTSLAFARTFFEWNWPRAEDAFQRAIQHGPGYATARQWYAELLAARGRFAEAEVQARRAAELDPLSLVMRTSLADVMFFARRYDEAIAVLRQALQVDPTFMAVLTDLGRVLVENGRYGEAIECFERAQQLGAAGKFSAGLAHAYARAGRTAEAREMLGRLKAQRTERYVSPHALAVVHLALGEHDAALEWLERALESRDRALVWSRVHPRLDPLRGHPRFERVLEGVGV